MSHGATRQTTIVLVLTCTSYDGARNGGGATPALRIRPRPTGETTAEPAGSDEGAYFCASAGGSVYFCGSAGGSVHFCGSAGGSVHFCGSIYFCGSALLLRQRQ
jgi:hypothetical protein